MNDDADGKSGRSWKRIVAWGSLWLALAVLGIGGWMAYEGVSVSLRAEDNFHSTLFTIRLVEQFVAEKKRWPASWDELEELSVSSDGPSPMNGRIAVVRIGGQHGYAWPAESNDLQQRVSIDFAADLLTVAAQDPMTFTVIKPIGPYYEYRDYGFVHSL